MVTGYCSGNHFLITDFYGLMDFTDFKDYFLLCECNVGTNPSE
jgi:hypothetical protein